ncbi:hypothetical protein [Acidaminobacter hydrogenoformans]|uniref:Uncharacterized protein n=1 Tax=Acidaminobacter hydrogenoformans DSM 2784 TaxID=1120920 RepID=A0A1G5S222_9FIRM|nr:hypothetical protein [Acidaminobacter hydrogenoformans]SCZ79791.1 hypothetical protein SAMN03080599_01930 [Acidaminobacter hydrogenoformans DSM 2784]
MKTKHLSLLLILSLVLNAYVILKIGGLNREVAQQGNQLQSQLHSLDSELGSLTYNIEQKLNAQASLLVSHEFDFGELNPEAFTVPVHVTVLPKRFEEGTAVKLVLNGQEVPMVPETDYALTGTLSVSVFEELHTAIVFEQGGRREIEELMVYGPLRYDYLPNFGAHFNGGFSHSEGSNTWRVNGEVMISLEPDRYKGEIKSVKLLELKDGVPVNTHETELTGYDIFVPIDQEVTLDSGQTYELMAVMEDNLGLTYEYYVDGFFLDSDNSFNGDQNLFERLTISDPDGRVVFTSEK